MYTVDQLAVRDLARNFAQTEVEPGAMVRDRESLFASTLIAKLGEMGFMGMLIPEHYGELVKILYRTYWLSKKLHTAMHHSLWR